MYAAAKKVKIYQQRGRFSKEILFFSNKLKVVPKSVKQKVHEDAISLKDGRDTSSRATLEFLSLKTTTGHLRITNQHLLIKTHK